jgi:multiple sugar transport system ATP-binding protein
MNIVEDNTIGVRPEHIALSDKKGEWQGTVKLAEHLGSDTFLHIDGGKRGQLVVRAAGESSFDPGSKVWMTPEKGRIHRFDREGKAVRA